MFIITKRGETPYPQIVNLNFVKGIYIYKKMLSTIVDRAHFLVEADFGDDTVTLSVHKTLEEAEAEIYRLYESMKEERKCNS